MRQNFKLVRDFIIPSLERQTYGHHLTWENKREGCFKISRIHQSSQQFNQDCIEVYKVWSLKKNLWLKDDPRKITKAKHRLISALRRNPEIETLKKESAYYRFRLTDIQTLGGDSSSNVFSQTNVGLVSKMTANNEKESCSDEFQEYSKYTNAKETNSFFLGESENVSMVESPLKFLQDIQNEQNHDELITPLISSDINSDKYILEANGKVCGDTCCCVLLLDGNFLCNKKCIWHGIFP